MPVASALATLDAVDDLLIPLFPLEVVLFPGQRLPLHIFEERYKTMIGEAVQAGTEFGIVLAKENAIVNVGCTAQVTDVTRKYDDGRMDILTVGRRRFEVLFVDEEREFLRAAAQFFQDEDVAASDLLASRVAELETQVLTLVPQDEAAAAAAPDSPLSYRVAAPLPLELDFKQTLLVLRTENERLERVCQYLQQLLPRLRLAAHTRAKSGGNGHCR